jgi:predicted acetyltransferase
MNIDIVEATAEDFRVVENLVPYYIYDMSEYMGWDCNTEGRWGGCDELPDYWKEGDHHPFMIKVDQKVAGFAMIRRYPDEPARYEVGEFFVARKFKGKQIGKRSAFWLFGAFPGKWIVRVLNDNTGARSFWDRVIHEYTGGDVAQTEEQYVCPHSGTWQMQFYRFESRSQQDAQADCRGTAPPTA